MRRRYHKRPKPVRRETPLLIECHGDTSPDPARVAIGNDTYLFAEDAGGRKVAPVADEDHIACFLARPEMYRPASR
jgi:hypothetical protein